MKVDFALAFGLNAEGTRYLKATTGVRVHGEGPPACSLAICIVLPIYRTLSEDVPHGGRFSPKQSVDQFLAMRPPRSKKLFRAVQVTNAIGERRASRFDNG